MMSLFKYSYEYNIITQFLISSKMPNTKIAWHQFCHENISACSYLLSTDYCMCVHQKFVSLLQIENRQPTFGSENNHVFLLHVKKHESRFAFVPGSTQPTTGSVTMHPAIYTNDHAKPDAIKMQVINSNSIEHVNRNQVYLTN